MAEITVSTRLQPEIREKLSEKALSEGLDISTCLKMLIYEYLSIETPHRLNKWVLLDFGLQIGEYKKNNCKHNVDGICRNWSWEEGELPKDSPIKFVEYEDFFGKRFYSEAIRERCAFCHSFERKERKKEEES